MEYAMDTPEDDLLGGPQAEAYAPSGRNVLGIVGFLAALLGLIAVGLVMTVEFVPGHEGATVLMILGAASPIGALLSALALTRQPRGYATLGVILGLAGTLFLCVLVIDKMNAADHAARIFQPAVDPTAATPDTQPIGNTITVDITADGRISIDGKSYDEIALIDYFRQLAARQPAPQVAFSVKKTTPDDLIVRLVMACQSRGLHVGLGKVTE